MVLSISNFVCFNDSIVDVWSLFSVVNASMVESFSWISQKNNFFWVAVSAAVSSILFVIVEMVESWVFISWVRSFTVVSISTIFFSMSLFAFSNDVIVDSLRCDSCFMVSIVDSFVSIDTNNSSTSVPISDIVDSIIVCACFKVSMVESLISDSCFMVTMVDSWP